MVVEAETRTEDPFGDPVRAVNGIVGAGERAGGTDVYSLGEGEAGALVLRWSGRRVMNGPGPDVVVFENPFFFAGGTFMDPVVVEVSAEGVSWVPFVHDYQAEDETTYSSAAEDWPGFAGRVPVSFRSADGGDPFADDAGGDRFDLDNLEDLPERRRILAEGFRFIRLVAASARANPDTGAPFPRSSLSDGPDIDGVAARYLEYE